MDDCNSSPLDLFLKRQIKPLTHLTPGNLPNMPEDRKWSWEKEVQLREDARQSRQERNQKLKSLPELTVGDRVLIQNPLNKKWFGPAFVTEQSKSKDSYWISFEDKSIRKHRKHLRKTPAPDPEYALRLKKGIFISEPEIILPDVSPPPAGATLNNNPDQAIPGSNPDRTIGQPDANPDIGCRITRSMT